MRSLVARVSAFTALALLLVAGVSAQEGQPLPDLDAEQKGKQRDEDVRYKQKKAAMLERLKEFRAQRQGERQDRLRALQLERAQKITPLKTTTVKVDEDTIEVKEPTSIEQALSLKQSVRDEYEVSPEDFDLYVHERWSLNKTDFQFDLPKYVVGDIRQGHTKRWFGFTYSITNSCTKARRIAPVFVAVTNKGVFMTEANGFLPQRVMADSSFHPLAGSKAPQDTLWLKENVLPLESAIRMLTHDLKGAEYSMPIPPKPMAKFLPGQVRWGVALWPRFNDELTELKIVIHGLNNALRFDRNQRRVLVLSFERIDDEFHVERERLHYKGKKWEYLWMWDQDLTVPIPEDPTNHQIQEKELTTPADAQKLAWSFPYILKNSSGSKQAITFNEIRFVLRGSKTGPKWSGFPIKVGNETVTIPEIHVVDDGRSTIYKAQYLREAGMAKPAEDTDRFAPKVEGSKRPGGMIHKIDANGKLERRAVFDIADADFEHVIEQVEARLTLKMDKKALAKKTWDKLVADKKVAGKDPGIIYNPQRFLTYDSLTLKDGRSFEGDVVRESERGVIFKSRTKGTLEFTKAEVDKVVKGERSAVKEQVLAAIPAALQATKQAKKIVAEYKCDAGLSSGSYRIARSYRQPGVIQEEWLKAWEELDK